MALYWPTERVALEVVDDPDSTPFTGPSDVEVITTTADELRDPSLLGNVVETLLDALGEELPDEEYERESLLRDVISRATEG